MCEINPSDETAVKGWGIGVDSLFSDPRHTRADCRLTARAVRERWPVPEKTRKLVIDQLLRIVDTVSVEVCDTNGSTVEVDGPADADAIAAARVLLLMSGQNQAEMQKTPIG